MSTSVTKNWFKLIPEALPFKLLYKTRIEKQ